MAPSLSFDLIPRTFSLTTGAYTILLSIILYYLFDWVDAVDLIVKICWNTLVFLTPTRVVIALDSDFRASQNKDHDDSEANMYQMEKSIAMRRVLGLENGAIMKLVQRSRALSCVGPLPSTKLPGLGNWDNSCYQNSVLQGLASIRSLPQFLSSPSDDKTDNTRSALLGLASRLNDESNHGTTLWTPARLKNMSSWQQQDAQEYFSKVLDEVEKDTARALGEEKRKQSRQGLSISDAVRKNVEANFGDEEAPKRDEKTESRVHELPEELRATLLQNPLEGLLAQRVGCQRCGYVEGLSLVPFTCLTLPLGKDLYYDIRDCLTEFSALEPIEGVECAKCTLLFAQKSISDILKKIPTPAPAPDQVEGISQEQIVFQSFRDRLDLVEASLKEEDFSEASLKKCLITAKSRISSTKSRQAVIGRAPQALVLHVNRSQFDEMTGAQTKNYAKVKFPLTFNLGPWYLGQDTNHTTSKGVEEWNTDPSVSMLPSFEHEDQVFNRDLQYRLRAAVTHYGRHENGHYICYRQSPDTTKNTVGKEGNERVWWQLSDQHVFEITEEEMLDQGGVFMLFYERIEVPDRLSADGPDSASNAEDVLIQKNTEITSTQPTGSENAAEVDPHPGVATKPDILPEETSALSPTVLIGKEAPQKISCPIPQALPTPPPSPKLQSAQV